MRQVPFPVRWRQWTGHAGFLANFGAAKLVIYLLPLAIAKFAPPATYGGIEVAWSAALLGAMVLVGAPLSGATQRYLIRKDRAVADEILGLTALFCGLSTIACFLARRWVTDSDALMALAALATAIIHNGCSAFFRMLGRRNFTAWADGTATLCAGLVVLAARLMVWQATPEAVVSCYLVLNVTVTLAAVIGFVATRKPGVLRRFWLSATIGLPMVAGAVLAIWLGVGGRLTVGLLAARDVAAYSVAFRVGGLAFGVHQLAGTAMFARIYRARTREADRLLARVLTLVTVMSTGLALGGAPVVRALHLRALDSAGTLVFARILPIVTLQIYFWIAFAMLQVRINRSGLAARALMPVAVVTLGGAGIIFGLNAWLGLGIVALSWLIAAQAAGYFAAELLVLARGRLPHRRVGLVALAGGGLLVAIALLMQVLG